MLIHDTRLLDIVSQLIGPDIRLVHYQGVYKPARTGGAVGWHQDNYYFEVEGNRTVSVWMALDDATAENGCMWYIPRAHDRIYPHEQLWDVAKKKGFYFAIPKGGIDDSDAIPVPVERGGLSVHHCLMPHRSLRNGTGPAAARPRHALHGREGARPRIPQAEPAAQARRRYCVESGAMVSEQGQRRGSSGLLAASFRLPCWIPRLIHRGVTLRSPVPQPENATIPHGRRGPAVRPVPARDGVDPIQPPPLTPRRSRQEEMLMSRTRITETPEELSCEEFDEIHHPRPHGDRLRPARGGGDLASRLPRRRHCLRRGPPSWSAPGCFRPSTSWAAGDRFGFEADPHQYGLDTVTVAPGYNWHVVAKWGEPMWSKGAEFDHMTRGTGESQELSFGDNNDGMWLYNDARRPERTRGQQRVHEPQDQSMAGRGAAAPENADDVRKGKAAHGVSVVEIAENDGKWSIVVDSPYNRRITADTPMEITGPARGHDLLRTAADPEGTCRASAPGTTAGTDARPGAPTSRARRISTATTPRAIPDIEIGPEFKRYGVGPKDSGIRVGDGGRALRHREAPQRAESGNGYIVEIDPTGP